MKHNPFANLSALVRDNKVRADAQAVEAENRRQAAEKRRELDRKAAEALAIERAAVEKRASEYAEKRSLLLGFLADLEACEEIGDGILPLETRKKNRTAKERRREKRAASRAKRAACEAAQARNLAEKKNRFAAEAAAGESNLNGGEPKSGWNVREEEGRPITPNQKWAWTGTPRHRSTSIISEYGVRVKVREPKYDYDIRLHDKQSGYTVRIRRVSNEETRWEPNIDVRFKGGCPNTRCTGPYQARARRTPDGWVRNGMVFPPDYEGEAPMDRTEVLTGPVPEGRPKRAYR